MNFRQPLLIILICLGLNSQAQEIREYIDLQTHPCMHLMFNKFGPGLTYFDESNPPELSHKHFFDNILYANYVRKNSGSRILCVGSLNKENASAKKGRKVVLAQIAYVNKVVADHPEDFALARTPQEVRDLIHNTDKTVFIHCIEGGRRLVESAEDAQFWADQGVAFITLIHLMDSKYGGSGIRPGFGTNLLNLGARFRRKKKRGLTEKGRNAIKWLADVGIMTDITHMSDSCRKQTLDFMMENDIPPLVTHDMFKPIQNHPRGIAEEDIIKIYQAGGMMSIPNSGVSLEPYNPREDYKKTLDSMEDYCPESIDSYIFTYNALNGFVKEHASEALNGQYADYMLLTEDQKVDLAIGFQSDNNGWLNHHRPRYGEEGCFRIERDTVYNPVDIQGLAHAGLIQDNWDLMESEGVDLDPIRRSSEKFLRMWEYFLDNKGRFEDHKESRGQ
ncbi:MAG: microsomal dipeptidase-like Zn-dependent dipeptidase [Bacteroidia bacterium]|jgi:microsomal dipeptidase-like Zn-dependent dipeptidase